ncbi:hypothetical protein CMI37_01375 [Candidatus Pacearchaeota archaeon]|nr:hypothetical protein [Candidatus Pacearchaeota archaeon]
MNSKLLIPAVLFVTAQTLVWFQLYSHYIWKWWENKPIAAALIYGIPASICFWYGTKIAVDATEAAWTARLLGFGMSYLTFPLLTWWLLNESMLTSKTMLCVLLSFMIVGIQLFWK